MSGLSPGRGLRAATFAGLPGQAAGKSSDIKDAAEQ